MSKPARTRSEKKAIGLDDLERLIQLEIKCEQPTKMKHTSALSSAFQAANSQSLGDKPGGISINLATKLFHQKKDMFKLLLKTIISIDLSENDLGNVIINGHTVPSLTCSNHNHTKYFNANIKFLERLILQKNSLVVFPQLFNLEHLTSLNLSRNFISSLPSTDNLVAFRNITQLNISQNNIETLHSSIGLLSQLTDLDLSNNRILRLPDELFNLIKLERLQLQDNLLTEILLSGLMKLERLKDGHKNGLNLRKNRLKIPPQEIAHKGIICIQDFYLNGGISNNLESMPFKKHLQTLITFKLFVLGHDGAGKTELVRSLHQQFSRIPADNYIPEYHSSDYDSGNSSSQKSNIYQSNELSGIDTSLIKVVETRMRRSSTGTVTTTDINIDIWHFKGGESYHAMHEIFFTPHALFIVTWKITSISSTLEDDINHNIQYWIDLVQARAPGAMILIVGTHADLLRSEEIDLVLDFTYKQLDRNAQERITLLEQRLDQIQDREMKRRLEEIIIERKRWKREIIPVNTKENISGIFQSTENSFGVLYPRSFDILGSSFTSPVRLSSAQSNISSLSSESASDILMSYATPTETPQSTKHRQPLFHGRITPPQPPDTRAFTLHENESLYKPNQSMQRLSSRILELATPSEENPHPFGNLGHDIPSYYSDVRTVLNEIKKTNDFCTVETISKKLMDDFNLTPSPDEHHTSLKRLHHALSYFSNIGEIFWIDSPALSNSVSDKSFHLSRLVFLRHRYLMDKVGSVLQENSWQDKVRSNDRIVSWKNVLNVMGFDTSIKPGTEKFNEGANSNVAPKTNENLRSESVHVERLHLERPERRFSRSESYVSETSEIQNYLRGLLEFYGVIIPIRVNHLNDSTNSTEPLKIPFLLAADIQQAHFQQQLHQQTPSTPTRARSSSAASNHGYLGVGNDEYQALNRDYLMPSLITNDDQSIMFGRLDDPVTSGTAQTSFKRCFRFENYVPPRLLHKVLAKVYAYKQLRPYIVKEYITKSTFILKFKFYRVLMRMKVDKGRGDASINVLEIEAHGFIFNSNDMLEKMDMLSDIVGAVLEDIPGLRPLVDQITFCPSCRSLSKQSSKKSTIGEFKWHVLSELRRQLDACDMSSDIELRAWRSRLCVCPADPQCQVQPEQLIHIPSQIKSKLDEIQKTEHIFQHLLEDIVATSSSFSSHLLGTQSNGVIETESRECLTTEKPGLDVRKSVVKVASVGPYMKRMNSFMANNHNAVNNKIIDDLTRKMQPVSFELQDINSGVLIEYNHPDGGYDQGTDKPSIVLTSEHFITEVMETVTGTRYSPKFPNANLFLVGDETHWHYLAKIVFQGSQHSLSDKKFWDICALEILTPISPEIIRLDPACIVVEKRSPSYPPPPLYPSPAASAYLIEQSTNAIAVAENQVVCLMGFPQAQSLSIDWGRVEKCDSTEILVNVISDYGNSGGPLFNSQGEVVGILSMSFDNRKYSSIVPLSDILVRLRNRLRR